LGNDIALCKSRGCLLSLLDA